MALLLAGCQQQWGNVENWYDSAALPDEDLVDVFYICSTEVMESRREDGSVSPTALLTDDERYALHMEMAYADGMFGDSLNFFSPYYHQFTFSSIFLPGNDFNAVYDDVRREIFSAFDYYMKRLNGGRRFIVAGFSQGAMLALELLKHMDDGQYARLVAAYLMGYRLSDEDIVHPHVVPATDAHGQGVAVSFNSVADTSSLWGFVSDGAVTCINPLNWRTDHTPATLSYEGDRAQVSVDTLRNVLVVTGLDREKYAFTLGGALPEGNYHHWDLIFYGDALRRNALHRSYAY